MSFPCEGNTLTLPPLPDVRRMRTAVTSQMRRRQEAVPWGQAADRVLKGYLYMTENWAGIFPITRVGTYLGTPVLSQYRSNARGIRHNEGLLLYENKEDAIHVLKACRQALEEIPAKEKFLRLDRVYLEESLIQDPIPRPWDRRHRPAEAYLLYLYITW